MHAIFELDVDTPRRFLIVSSTNWHPKCILSLPSFSLGTHPSSKAAQVAAAQYCQPTACLDLQRPKRHRRAFRGRQCIKFSFGLISLNVVGNQESLFLSFLSQSAEVLISISLCQVRLWDQNVRDNSTCRQDKYATPREYSRQRYASKMCIR